MSNNPLVLFSVLFTSIFAIMGLIEVLGFFNASYAAGASGNSLQLTNTITTEFYSLIGYAIGDTFVSLIGSTLLTILIFILEASSNRGGGHF